MIVTFKDSLREEVGGGGISLSSLVSKCCVPSCLRSTVVAEHNPQSSVRRKAFNYGGGEAGELTAGHTPPASSSLEHLEMVSLNFSSTVDSYLLRDGRSNLGVWTLGQSESVPL